MTANFLQKPRGVPDVTSIIYLGTVMLCVFASMPRVHSSTGSVQGTHLPGETGQTTCQ